MGPPADSTPPTPLPHTALADPSRPPVAQPQTRPDQPPTHLVAAPHVPRDPSADPVPALGASPPPSPHEACQHDSADDPASQLPPLPPPATSHCVICLADIAPADCRFVPPCGHELHGVCWASWTTACASDHCATVCGLCRAVPRPAPPPPTAMAVDAPSAAGAPHHPPPTLPRIPGRTAHLRSFLPFTTPRRQPMLALACTSNHNCTSSVGFTPSTCCWGSRR